MVLRIKAHIGVDANTELTHSLSTSAANVHDITESENLLYGEETYISTDSGYRSSQKREELKEIKVNCLIAAFLKEKTKQGTSSQKAPENKQATNPNEIH